MLVLKSNAYIITIIINSLNSQLSGQKKIQHYVIYKRHIHTLRPRRTESNRIEREPGKQQLKLAAVAI